jgi:hypothetical protein
VLNLGDPYWWTQDHPVTTLTFVEGRSQDQVAAALTCVADGHARRLDQVDPFTIRTGQGPDLHRVQVAEEGVWTVLVEPNGFAGIHLPLIPRLSPQARQVALYRSINSVMTFLHAEAGFVTRTFDPLLFPDVQNGMPLAEEAGLVFGWDEQEERAGRTTDPFRQALHLVERLTGFSLTSRWLFETPRPVYLMPADPTLVERG